MTELIYQEPNTNIRVRQSPNERELEVLLESHFENDFGSEDSYSKRIENNNELTNSENEDSDVVVLGPAQMKEYQK